MLHGFCWVFQRVFPYSCSLFLFVPIVPFFHLNLGPSPNELQHFLKKPSVSISYGIYDFACDLKFNMLRQTGWCFEMQYIYILVYVHRHMTFIDLGWSPMTDICWMGWNYQQAPMWPAAPLAAQAAQDAQHFFLETPVAGYDVRMMFDIMLVVYPALLHIIILSYYYIFLNGYPRSNGFICAITG